MQPDRRKFERTILNGWRLVICTAKGIPQVEEASVTAIRLTDALVQAEVDQSLRASFGRIKPDSSQVELTLRPHPGSTAATVTYAKPVAAWKIRY